MILGFLLIALALWVESFSLLLGIHAVCDDVA